MQKGKFVVFSAFSRLCLLLCLAMMLAPAGCGGLGGDDSGKGPGADTGKPGGGNGGDGPGQTGGQGEVKAAKVEVSTSGTDGPVEMGETETTLDIPEDAVT
jgi:hypothetical protein